MCSNTTSRAPFGPPAVKTTPLVSGFPAGRCLTAVDLYGHLRGVGKGRGLVLLESGASPGQVLPTTRCSVVVTRALLRIELRGGCARYVALVPEAHGLLEQLAGRLPRARRDGDALVAEFPVSPGEPGVVDGERLRAASVLDGLRAGAALIGDRGTAVPLAPGLFGALGYELVDHFEALPPRRPDPLDEPDASMVLAADAVVFDHRSEDAQVITRGLPWEEVRAVQSRHDAVCGLLTGAAARASAPRELPPPAPPQAAVADTSDADFRVSVRAMLDQIAAGEIFQVVLSRGLKMVSAADSLDVYRVLSARNPSPYMFHMDLPDGALLGASPETFLRVEGGQLEIRPIAGTVARGRDAAGEIDGDLDDRLALSLLLDQKEQAEHAMLLDLARNDVARVSEPGTTAVVQQFAVEKYSHVQHIVSRVRGTLRSGLDALHAYRAAANMGTLTGAPKVRAMELIRAAEPTARGFYGGAMGYLLQDGRFDSCIVIRSLRAGANAYHTRAGAGVVWASSPEKELQETEHKARAVREAVAAAESEVRR